MSIINADHYTCTRIHNTSRADIHINNNPRSRVDINSDNDDHTDACASRAPRADLVH